jgi:terminase small subunit-like protein
MKPPEVRQRAIELLVEGRSVVSVARELGCAQATIRAWRNAEPGFWPRFWRARAERFARLVDEALEAARADAAAGPP